MPARFRPARPECFERQVRQVYAYPCAHGREQ
jgi:hypothetical protein